MLASWFPQITVDDTKVFTALFITRPFQVLSITNLVQQVYTTTRFYVCAKRPACSVHKHREKVPKGNDCYHRVTTYSILFTSGVYVKRKINFLKSKKILIENV